MSETIVVAADRGLYIGSIEDVSEVMGHCFSSHGLLITEAELSGDFFNLRTGIAGELFQKCTNYQINLALVVKDFSAYGERFSELIYEHRNHRAIRFYSSELEAREWLSEN
jgi:hypothetical protein